MKTCVAPSSSVPQRIGKFKQRLLGLFVFILGWEWLRVGLGDSQVVSSGPPISFQKLLVLSGKRWEERCIHLKETKEPFVFFVSFCIMAGLLIVGYIFVIVSRSINWEGTYI